MGEHPVEGRPGGHLLRIRLSCWMSERSGLAQSWIRRPLHGWRTLRVEGHQGARSSLPITRQLECASISDPTSGNSVPSITLVILLRYRLNSESMGHHDSEIMDDRRVG